MALAVPFLGLALAQPGARGHETGSLTVLLASLAPVAAWPGSPGGPAARPPSTAPPAQVIAGTLLEHTARGERARISRELHDVVAHHISMIAVQAETARLTTPGMPAAGAQRLLGDRRHRPGRADRDAPAARRAARGHRGRGRRTGSRSRACAQLTELLDEARDASGAGTRLIVSGWPAPLDPGVELAAYRIVQEALTNARRHAPGAAVDVELHFADDAAAAAHPRQRAGPAPPARVRPGSPAATGCSACASGPPPSAASCAPARRPAAASWSRPALPGKAEVTG